MCCPCRAREVVEVRGRRHRLVARERGEVPGSARVDGREIDHRGAGIVGHHAREADPQHVAARHRHGVACVDGPDGRTGRHEAERLGRCRELWCGQSRRRSELEQPRLVERWVVERQWLHLPGVVGDRHDEVAGVGSPRHQLGRVRVRAPVDRASRHRHRLHRHPRPLGCRRHVDTNSAAVPAADLHDRGPHPVDQPWLHRVAGPIGCDADRCGAAAVGDPVVAIPVARLLIEATHRNASDEHLRRRWRRGIGQVELIVRPAEQIAERPVGLDRRSVDDRSVRDGRQFERDEIERGHVEPRHPHRHGMRG